MHHRRAIGKSQKKTAKKFPSSRNKAWSETVRRCEAIVMKASGQAAKVFMALKGLADLDGYCWPLVSTLAALTGIHRRPTLFDALNELEKLGVMTRAQLSSKIQGRNSPNIYRLGGPIKAIPDNASRQYARTLKPRSVTRSRGDAAESAPAVVALSATTATRDQAKKTVTSQIAQETITLAVTSRSRCEVTDSVTSRTPRCEVTDSVTTPVTESVTTPVTQSVTQNYSIELRHGTTGVATDIVANSLAVPLDRTGADTFKSHARAWHRFVDEYPNKMGLDAQWTKHAFFFMKCHEIPEAVFFGGLKRWKDSAQWSDPQFIPQAKKFLEQKRWQHKPPEGRKFNGQNLSPDERTEIWLANLQLARNGEDG